MLTQITYNNMVQGALDKEYVQSKEWIEEQIAFTPLVLKVQGDKYTLKNILNDTENNTLCKDVSLKEACKVVWTMINFYGYRGKTEYPINLFMIDYASFRYQGKTHAEWCLWGSGGNYKYYRILTLKDHFKFLKYIQVLCPIEDKDIDIFYR